MTFFSTALDAILTRRDWTQSDLAARTGIRQASVSEYVNAKTVPTADSFRRILLAVDDDNDRRELINASFRDLVPREYADLVLLSFTGDSPTLREEATHAWLAAPLPAETTDALRILAAAAATDADLQAALRSLADFIRSTQTPARRIK